MILRKRSQRLPALLGVLAVVHCFSSALSAQSSEEALFENLPDHRARLVERVEDWAANPDRVGFAPELLSEWSLSAFSRWELLGRRNWSLKVWKMLDAQGAFGLFTEHRWRAGAETGRTLELSFDNFLSPAGLAFWRDRRFMLLEARGGGAPGDGEWASLAEALSERVSEPNLYPFTLVQLPLLDLDADSVRFFLGEAGLGSDEAFPPRLLRAVGFDKQAEVVSARYGPSRLPFFLFGYPTASLAERQAAAINGVLQSIYTPEGAWMKRSALLVGVFFGPEEEARKVLDQLQYDAKVKWIYERGLTEEERLRRRGEVISFFGVVTSSILFTGFFAVVVIAAGFVTGIVRYHAIKRFPILTTRKEMIRLDL